MTMFADRSRFAACLLWACRLSLLTIGVVVPLALFGMTRTALITVTVALTIQTFALERVRVFVASTREPRS